MMIDGFGDSIYVISSIGLIIIHGYEFEGDINKETKNKQTIRVCVNMCILIRKIPISM